MSRRAQISMFLIVAVVLVILGGFAYYVSTRLSRTQDASIAVHTDIQPVQAFVTSCLTGATRASLAAVGETGGYVNPSTFGYSGVSVNPTEGRALAAFAGRPVIPYWSYLKSRNECTNCISGSEQPPLEGPYPSIEGQLERDIATRTLACINNFETFAGSMNITAPAAPKVTVTFGEHNTIATMQYPVTVVAAGQSPLHNDQFVADVDVPLKHLYTAADQVVRQAQSSHFFEGLALEAITLESVNESIPAPAGGVSISYDPGPIWSLAQVRDRVAEILSRNVGIVQLFAARNMNFIRTGNDTKDRMYSNYYFTIGTTPSDIDASFITLPDWTPYVHVSPGGQVIRPDRMTTGLFFLPQFKRMDFQYDVSFPVLIQLSSDTSQGPYTFQFPIEANMRNNAPISTQPAPTTGDTQGPQFCDNASAVGSTADIHVSEATTGSPMSASFRYECAQEVCYYGDSTSGHASVQLPPCVGGSLVAQRDGFKDARVSFDSVVNATTVANLQLVKLTDVGVAIQPWSLARTSRDMSDPNSPVLGDWAVSGQLQPFAEGYKTIVTFTPVDDPDYAQVYVYPQEEGGTSPSSIQLYPGDYTVSAVVIKNLDTPHVVKGREECAHVIVDISCTTIPDITFGDGSPLTLDDGTQASPPAGVMYVGGVQLDNSTHVVTITQAMLDSGTLTVPVLVVPLSELQVVDDLDVLSKLGDFSNGLYVQ